MPISRNLAGWKGNVLLLGCSVLMMAAATEIALRLGGISYPYFTRVDPVTGFSLRPDIAAWDRSEGDGYVEINSRGIRDKEHVIPKPEGVYRIAVLGDSYTEARQVNIEDTFPRIVEEMLKGCPAWNGTTVETVNFGVSGFGTTQEYLQMQDRVWQYEPDAMLLAFTTGNDVVNNSKKMEVNDQKPYFLLESGTLVLDTSFLDTSFYRSQTSIKGKLLLGVLHHSRILQVVNEGRRQYKKAKALRLAEAMERKIPGDEAGIEPGAFAPPRTDAWKEAWKITEEVLRMMAEEAKAHKTPMMIVTLSSGMQAHPDKQAREDYMRQRLITDEFYADKRIADFGKSIGVPVLILAPELQKVADRDQVTLHGFAKGTPGYGHWNKRGHTEAGIRIAEFLCKNAAQFSR